MKAAVFIACVLVAASTAQAADEGLGKAKDLYAAAAYDDALVVLDGLAKGSAPPEMAGIDEYRAFCLYALGRTNEADAIFASLMKRDPAFHIEETDASPRVEAAFAAVRKRVLPDLIREQYRAAREALASKSTETAEARLLQAKQMLVEAKSAGAWNDTLSDLQMLVDGFLDLNGAAATKPAASAPDPRAPAADPAKASPSAAPASQGPREYDVEEKDVTPPIAIRHSVPGVPASLYAFLQRKSALFEVHVDATGAVRRVVVRRSLYPAYDDRLVEAISGWQYHPAVKAGSPVAYVAFVEIDVNR